MRLADQLRTTTFHLTLRYMVLLFVSVTILVGFINWTTLQFFEEQTALTIDAEVKGLREQYLQRGLNGLVQVIAARIAANPEGDALYLIVDTDMAPQVGNLMEWPDLRLSEDGWVDFIHTKQTGESIPARGRVFAPSETVRLLVARELRAIEQLSRLLDRTLFWTLGITLALAMMGGLLMSNNVLRRVNAINSTSKKIMHGDLSQRIATRGTRDEFDELAENLNAMLEQIETLMGSIQHISDNVAHDLRTPLTRLRNRLEDVRRRNNAGDTEDIDACLEDADGLLSTFASLLSIARIESGVYETSRKLVALDEIVLDACEMYQAVAEEKSIALSCNAGKSIKIYGDRNLIFQVLTNLLDNAIKYTPAGGRVTAALEKQDEGIILAVSDTGPGIPEPMHEKVLQRFYRLDKSRSKPGAGLGLSLVQAIALHHKAKMILRDNGPGLQVELVFPVPEQTSQ